MVCCDADAFVNLNVKSKSRQKKDLITQIRLMFFDAEEAREKYEQEPSEKTLAFDAIYNLPQWQTSDHFKANRFVFVSCRDFILRDRNKSTKLTKECEEMWMCGKKEPGERRVQRPRGARPMELFAYSFMEFRLMDCVLYQFSLRLRFVQNKSKINSLRFLLENTNAVSHDLRRKQEETRQAKTRFSSYFV